MAVIAHAEELTSLDQAIGDGDHGINMKRGFEAVLTDIDGFATRPLPDALHAIGMALLMKIGGASGPLRNFVHDARKGVAGVAFGRGGRTGSRCGDRGDQSAWQIRNGREDDARCARARASGAAAGGAELTARLRRRAFDAAAATTPMKALRGRASFLGDRSIGHMDPGARSSCLMVAAVCDVIGG